MAHFNLLIQPEEGSGSFPVSLWAIGVSGAGQQLYTAPRASWLDYSHRLEQSKVMDAGNLGRADACIFRGEPVVQAVQCSPCDLAQVGFGESEAALPGHVSLGSLLSRVDSAQDAVLDPARGNGSYAEPEPPGHAMGAGVESKAMRPFRQRIALLGVSIDNLSMNEVVETIDGLIEKGGHYQVATANVDFLTKALDDCELLEILHRCELVVPDGMPLVWASKILGAPLKERVTGADLVPRLLELSSRKKRRIFLLGATEESSRAAAERIRNDYPAAVICGRYSPTFASGEAVEDELILQLIREANPDLLLVAFGNPKQEKWLARHRDRLEVPVCIGVGASIDFLSGIQFRAPLWMQQMGMEWMHRLINQPRRLALRYLNNLLFLLRYLPVQVVMTALQPRAVREGQIRLVWHGNVLTVGIAGAFCGSAAKTLFDELDRCNHDGSLILDLSSARFISPDAIGLLAYLAQRCARTGDELWITGGMPILRSVLKATFPSGGPFRLAMTLQDALTIVWPPSVRETTLDTLGSEAA